METIRMLTPENLRILSASRQYEGKMHDEEPWYKTPFSVERISDDVVKQWKSSPIDARMHLPSLNPFIASDFSLKQNIEKMDHPCLLRKTSMSSLWFKSDLTFKTPKACIRIQFYCPESFNTPEATILSRLFIWLLLDYLNEHAYYAEVAGLFYLISQTTDGFKVSVSGFHHKIIPLLHKILERIVNFQVVEARFMIVKENLLKHYLNLSFCQPYEQALCYRSLILQDKDWDIKTLIEAIAPLEAADLASFFPRLMSRLYFECYVSGNMNAAEAENMTVMIEKSLVDGPVFKSKSVFGAQHAERRTVRLESRCDAYYPVAGSNLADANSALRLYLQVGQDDELLNVLLELFVLSTKQEVFHQLRSVQQLGYIVYLTDRDDYGVRGAEFIIQSALKDPKDLEATVEVFLSSLGDYLRQLTDEEFKNNVNALIGRKLEKPKNLFEERSLFWNEIEAGTLKFSRQEDEVAVLRKLCKEDLLDFYENYIKAGAPRRAKLSICVYGGAHQEEFKSVIDEGKDKACDVPEEIKGIHQRGEAPFRIKDMFEFKRSQGLYGSLK